MRVNEGALWLYKKFTDHYKDCLHDHTCMLSKGTEAAQPYWGLNRRSRDARLMLSEGSQPDLDKLEVDQQSTYDTSYPADMRDKWKDGNKVRLVIVQEFETVKLENGVDPKHTIRVLNTCNTVSVLFSFLSPCTYPDTADISLHQNKIDSNALESPISKEHLDKLWHNDQVTLPKHSRLYLYWHQKLQQPNHMSMVRVIEKGSLPSALKYARKVSPFAALLFTKAQKRAWKNKGKISSSIRKAHHNLPRKGISADHINSHQPGLIPQVTGKLTHDNYWGSVTMSTTVAEIVEAKTACERILHKYDHEVEAYYGDNSRFDFEDF
eukprot:8916398-Ditylum_brightwellii.AAC.1